MRHGIHLLVRLIAGAVALVVVLLALAAARLAAGPVPIGFLASTLAQVIGTAAGAKIDIADATLTWRDWQRGLLLDLQGVQATKDSGAGRAAIDRIAIALSPPALASGVIAPSSVEVQGGDVAIVDRRSEAAEPSAPAEAGDQPTLARILADLSAQPHPGDPQSYLLDARIENVAVTIANDRPEPDWRILIDDARFARHGGAGQGHGGPGDGGPHGQAAISLSRGEELGTLTLDIAPSGDAGTGLEATVAFDRVRPVPFAALAPALAPLAALDLPLKGTLQVSVDAAGAVGTGTAAISGGPGTLVLTRQLAKTAGLDAPDQRLAVRSLEVQGTFAPSGEAIGVQNAVIAFAPGTMLHVPAPIDHRFPLAGIAVSGTYARGKLDLAQATLDLVDLRLAASGALEGLPQAASGTIDLVARGLKVNDFRRYWPRSLASGAYDWCTQHLRDGVVPQAHARLVLASRNGSTTVGSFTGGFDTERLTVDYLPPMPAIRDARGSATFDMKSLRLTVTGGESAGITIRGGTVDFPDLDHDPPSIAIDARLTGPVRGAMNVIASQPLAYPQRAGIDPSQSSGDFSGRLKLAFPLLDDLPDERIDVDATVDLTNFGLTDVAPGIDVTRGQARLAIDSRRLRAEGRLAIGGVEGAVNWVQSFYAGPQPQTALEFVVDDAPIRNMSRHLPDADVIDDYLLGGALDGRIEVEIADDNSGIIRGAVDLKATKLAIPHLGWSKEPGTPGRAEVTLRMAKERITDAPHILVTAPGLDLGGSLRLTEAGGLDSVTVDTLVAGDTNATGTLAKLADGTWDIVVGGTGLDLRPLRASSGEGAAESGSSPAKWPDFTLAADVGTLWFGPSDPIGKLLATLVHRDGLWQLVQVQGELQQGSSVELSIAPDTDGRALNIDAGNAGAALRAFGLFSDMVGGTLHAEGQIDDRDRLHPLSGRLKVKSYNIINTPVLARLLSILALTGIRDALGGRGIYFSMLDVPFKASSGVIDIDGARAFGSSLGITTSGTIDTTRNTLALNGQLVPFYAVNSALGRLPLVGNILTGNEQGGGLISASYAVTGPLDDPAVSVNPASVLFPGFLRWILETFQGWVEPGSLEAAPESAGNN